jgi:hypothetical protein|tara:strand:+ start:27 stop:701 length:675 start_codon:yes stop_codon:yes gene_type:complete
MASVVKPHIITDDLVFCVDKNDRKCDFYGTAKDRAQNITTASNNSTSQNYSTDSVSSFLSDASQITAMVWVTKTGTSTGYAEHPLNKWQTSGNALGGAAIILYHFGNYNSNGDDGEFAFYFGLGGDTWSGTGRTTLVVGDSAFLCLQYTASTGSQFWRDGEIVQSRANTGKGNIGTDSVARNFILYTGPASNNSYVSKVMIYDKDVDDDVIIHNYNVTKSRFGH